MPLCAGIFIHARRVGTRCCWVVLWYDLCANTINHKEVYMSDNYPFEGYRYPERQDRPSPDSQVPYRPTERQPEPEPKK